MCVGKFYKFRIGTAREANFVALAFVLERICLVCLGFFFFFLVFFFLEPHTQHMEVPRLGVESEMQPSYTTVSAMPDPSLVWDLYHSSQQCQIHNPLRKARDWTRILMDTNWVCYHWATTGTPRIFFFLIAWKFHIDSLIFFMNQTWLRHLILPIIMCPLPPSLFKPLFPRLENKILIVPIPHIVRIRLGFLCIQSTSDCYILSRKTF